MPRVPTYDSLQATPNTLPQSPLTMPQMPDIAGQQAQQTGRTLMAGGQAMGQVAFDMQQQANQLRIDDALNQAKEAALRLTYDKDSGFASLKGINALQRPNGKPLADEYGDNLKQQITQIAGTLGNDAQRQVFALHSNDILTSFRGQAIQHEAGEFKTYGLSVSEGVQSTALRDIGLNWNNPNAVNSAVERIRAETYRQAQLLGKSAEWQEAQTRKMTSNAHTLAIESAVKSGNLQYADAYRSRYASQMDADDISKVQGLITKEMDSRIGFAVATDAVGKLPLRISEGERAFNIALNTESGGRQFSTDGKPLTSPKGAVGIAQVMPGTGPEAAKMAGLPWDENRYRNDATYNRALGMAYFQKQLQDNGGDLAKAYAAYNAGPGALKAAIQRADAANKNPQNIGTKSWVDFVPKETQDYVAKNMRAFNAGQGQMARPTIADIETQLQNDPRLANNPERFKIARVEAERQFNQQTAALKQRDEESTADALRGLYENGGRFSELPVSVRANIPSEKLTSVMNAAERIAKGDDTTSLWLYNKLTNNPDELARMSDDQLYALRTSLSETDFKHFSQERAKLMGSVSGRGGAGDLNTQAIKSGLDTRLRMMGSDPTPKDGSKDAERIGGMRQFVDRYFIAAQREAGKKFSDAEVEQHLDALFMKNATVRGWFSNSSVSMLSMKIGDIDGNTKSDIKAAFKRVGIDSPTDAQILNAYWSLQVARK